MLTQVFPRIYEGIAASKCRRADASGGRLMVERDQQTEKPTQRKLQKARKEGQFPVSKEFVNGVHFSRFRRVELLRTGSGFQAWPVYLAARVRIAVSTWN